MLPSASYVMLLGVGEGKVWVRLVRDWWSGEKVKPRHGWCVAVGSWAAYTGLRGIVAFGRCRSQASGLLAVVDPAP